MSNKLLFSWVSKRIIYLPVTQYDILLGFFNHTCIHIFVKQDKMGVFTIYM